MGEGKRRFVPYFKSFICEDSRQSNKSNADVGRRGKIKAIVGEARAVIKLKISGSGMLTSFCVEHAFFSKPMKYSSRRTSMGKPGQPQPSIIGSDGTPSDSINCTAMQAIERISPWRQR